MYGLRIKRRTGPITRQHLIWILFAVFAKKSRYFGKNVAPFTFHQAYLKTIVHRIMNNFFTGVITRLNNLMDSPRPTKNLANQVVLFIGQLLVGIQLVVFVVIIHFISSDLRQQVDEQLQAGETKFLHYLDERKQQQIAATTALLADPVFQNALIAGNRNTVNLLLHDNKVLQGAAKVVLVSLDGIVSTDI